MKRNMHIRASGLIFRYASELRSHQTLAEKMLWERIGNRQIEGEKFRRQHPAKKFVLDFYCYRLRLGIELDGRQHSLPANQFHDNDRSEILEDNGIYILRFTNFEVINSIDEVIEKIKSAVLELKSNFKQD